MAAGLSDEIQAALASLPEEFRVPVVLRDVADRTYEEIAGSLGVPVGTVRSRLHRGRRMLRRPGEERSSGMSAIEPPEELLSAYLDGEVDRRRARARRATARGVRRVARGARRGARDATLLLGLPLREAPTGFWDSLLAPGHRAAGAARDRRSTRRGAAQAGRRLARRRRGGGRDRRRRARARASPG